MTEAEFESQLESAKREAMKSFGDEGPILWNLLRPKKFLDNFLPLNFHIFPQEL
jgi:acetyl/propionyl-CoA carboxylase alpha subunit